MIPRKMLICQAASAANLTFAAFRGGFLFSPLNAA